MSDKYVSNALLKCISSYVNSNVLQRRWSRCDIPEISRLGKNASELQLSSAIDICQMADNDSYWQLNQRPFYILNNITEPMYFHPYSGRKCHLPDEEMEAQRSFIHARVLIQNAHTDLTKSSFFSKWLKSDIYRNFIDRNHSLALLLIFKSKIIKIWASSSIFHLWPSPCLSWIQMITN